MTYVWWQRVRHIDLQHAWQGFSPLIYVYQKFQPENFIRDFPNGAEAYDASLVMRLYPWLYSSFGIKPEAVVPIFIAVEHILFATAIIILTRTLKPKTSKVVPVLVTILLLASYAPNMNLARFGIVYGLYYVTAHSFRLLAIAALLKGRYFLAGVLILMTFLNHPTIGLMGGIFLFSASLARPIKIFKLRYLGFAILLSATAFLWISLVVSPEAHLANEIPKDIWFSFSKLGSVHWYPVDYGHFTFNHQERFIPFLSLTLLFVYYFTRTPLDEKKRRIFYGCLAMVSLVCIGVVFSMTQLSTTIVKLSLHRANDIITFISIIYVTDGLWQEIRQGYVWRRPVASAILISPLVFKPGFPLALSIILTSPIVFRFLRQRDRSLHTLSVTSLIVVCITLVGLYALHGMLDSWKISAYTGLASKYFLLVPIVLVVVVLLLRLLHLNLLKNLVLVLFLGLAYLWQESQSLSSQEIALRRDYYRVQIWAKNNTQKSALFMVDPTIYYGWRDYSHRSSFGNLREWILLSCCVYKSDFNVYQEGMRRFREFQIDIDKYLEVEPSLLGFRQLNDAIREKYYSLDDSWRLNINQTYGVDYFLLIKDRMNHNSDFPIIYQNDSFVVLHTSSDASYQETFENLNSVNMKFAL
ncbi:hypothetical protein [Halomicronema hongdechloris]|uniref:hypothetical protein n=1 Tax=Halomicronema hongdechloris TaxID=1209493 RepID=UPI0010CBA5A3|nr:hypothetical protein [Halomicronema hongdechloris]